MRCCVTEEWILLSAIPRAFKAHSNAYEHSRLRLVAVDKQTKVVIVDVEVGPEVASQGNRSDQFAQPPHNLRACAWVWRNDEDRFGQD